MTRGGRQNLKSGMLGLENSKWARPKLSNMAENRKSTLMISQKKKHEVQVEVDEQGGYASGIARLDVAIEE